MLEKECKDRKVFFVFGGTDTEIREEIRALTEKENDAIIVASYGTFSTGVNIVNLHNIIFASPSKSQIRVLQSVGRGLRKSDQDTILYDIADDLHWKANKNYTLTHSAERVKIYSKEKFKFKMKKIKVGHAGTLDPLATGLLIICIGKQTKSISEYQNLSKTYTGKFKLGESTLSYDAETDVNEKFEYEHITFDDLKRLADEFIGRNMQKPPIFSAIKKDGKRLYEYARENLSLIHI